MAITKSVRKKIVLAAILLALLLGLLLYFLYYNSTKKLTFDIAGTTADALTAPEFLYQFAGVGANKMQTPVGVYVDKESQLVYVCDTTFRQVMVYKEDGTWVRNFGQGEFGMPLYVSKNPVDGNIYVSDRDKFTVLIFSPEGKKVGEYKPKLPKSEMPDKKKAAGLLWKPRALAFDESGALYATDFIMMRVLVFEADGSFRVAFGSQGMVNDRRKAVEAMYYPSAITVQGSKVYVADSNNGRILVYSDQGKFEEVVVTTGLPRGVGVLDKLPGQKAETPNRIVSADTLGHMANIWGDNSQSLAQFGENGVLEGQFNYPEGVSVGTKNKMFIADTKNGRVQVWGWPEIVSPVPVPKVPSYWYYCLIPLLFLPALLFLRKRKVYVTDDFIAAMMLTEEGQDTFLRARVTWFVLPNVFEKYDATKIGDQTLGKILTETQYSESDARALMNKYEIPEYMAIDLAVANRIQILGTTNAEERKYARMAEIDVVNPEEAVARFRPKDKRSKGDNGEGTSAKK